MPESTFITPASAYGVYKAASCDFPAKIFPLYVCLFLFIVAGIHLIQEIVTRQKGIRESGSGVGDLETKWAVPMTVVWKNRSRI